MPNKVIRAIHAADNETIEVHWRRAPQHAGGSLGTELIMRYTAPPPDVWEARLKSEDPDPLLPFTKEPDA